MDGSPTLLSRADSALKSRADEFPAVIGALHLVTVFLDVSILGVSGFRVLHITILVCYTTHYYQPFTFILLSFTTPHFPTFTDLQAWVEKPTRPMHFGKSGRAFEERLGSWVPFGKGDRGV